MSNARQSVVVAMSGGVDSSAAAVLLAARGFEVTGVSFRVWLDCDLGSITDPRSCCSLRDMELAADVCHILGIEHLAIDISDLFFSSVVEPFAKVYINGQTPNPCVECNSLVKFPMLINAAEGIGAFYIATGHYALTLDGDGGYTSLFRARSKRKDQSYALYRLGQEELRRCIFPNGAMSKEDIRAVAERAGLPVAQKRESQELCFISGRGYRGFLSSRFPEALSPGPILDTSGKLLTEHGGIAFFTIGQRSGLGVSTSRPLYVVALDPDRQAVIVGDRDQVPGEWLRAESVLWIRGHPPGESFQAEAMVRYNSAPVTCMVRTTEAGFEADFEKRIWAITPGQHVVLYRGNEVIGGGVIVEAR